MMFSTSERKYPHDLAPASKVIFILNEIGIKTRASHLAFEERAVFRLAKAEENLIRESG